MPTIAQGIVEEYRTRVMQIQRPTFETDAGKTVFLGERPSLGPDDPAEAIAILLGEQEVTHNRENVRYEWPIDILALAKADLDQPYIALLQVVGDIKRAVELPDRTLGGLVTPWFVRQTVRMLEREPGSTTVAAMVRYVNPVVEQWGNP